jgi:hypothetical protein
MSTPYPSSLRKLVLNTPCRPVQVHVVRGCQFYLPFSYTGLPPPMKIWQARGGSIGKINGVLGAIVPGMVPKASDSVSLYQCPAGI